MQISAVSSVMQSYLLIIDLQVRHANTVLPTIFLFLLSLHGFEDTADSPRDDTWLLSTAQHGMCLTYKLGHQLSIGS